MLAHRAFGFSCVSRRDRCDDAAMLHNIASLAAASSRLLAEPPPGRILPDAVDDVYECEKKLFPAASAIARWNAPSQSSRLSASPSAMNRSSRQGASVVRDRHWMPSMLRAAPTPVRFPASLPSPRAGWSGSTSRPTGWAVRRTLARRTSLCPDGARSVPRPRTPRAPAAARVARCRSAMRAPVQAAGAAPGPKDPSSSRLRNCRKAKFELSDAASSDAHAADAQPEPLANWCTGAFPMGSLR